MSSKDKHAVILIPSKHKPYYLHIYIQIQETIYNFIARKSALEKTQLSDVLITDNLL